MVQKLMFSFCLLLTLVLLAGTSSAKIRGSFTKFEAKKAGQTVVPLKQFCCGFTLVSCATKCLWMNSNGGCCTAYSIASDGLCTLYDADPDAFDPIQANNIGVDIVFSLPDSPRCEVAFIVGGYALNPTSVVGSPFVEVYSPNGGCSYNLAQLPYDLTDFSLFLYGTDTILACGGYSDQIRSWNRNCWNYDVPTNSWITMTTYNNNHHRSTPFLAYQNKIYCFDNGGAEVYNPQSNAWSAGVTVPGNIGEGECSLLYRDSVFIFGGRKNVQYVQKYNFTTGIWTFPFTLNNGIFFSNCYLLPKTVGKVLIVAVDSCCGTTTQTATIIDLETNQQTPISNPKFLRGWGNSLVMLGTRLFVVNGWNWSANVPIVEEYHSSNNSWSKVTAPMIYPRHRGAAISVPASWFSNMTNGCKGVI